MNGFTQVNRFDSRESYNRDTIMIIKRSITSKVHVFQV